MQQNGDLTTKRIEDPVTGLHNRQSFFQLLQKRVTNAALNKRKLALLVIDIDNFERINHIYGYTRGDEILRRFADLLEEIRREQDHVARIGDSRFALILRDVLNQGHARLAALKINKLLENPFDFDGKKVALTVSTGIALCPYHATEHNGLMRMAEMALDVAQSEQSLVEIANQQEEQKISEYWDLELLLEDALRLSQLEVHYQPKVSLTTGKPIGAEALMRWKTFDRDYIRPDIFIPIAEQTGLIKPMTNWLINTVLRHSQQWTDRWGKLSVSVNIPPQMLLQSDFMELLKSALNLWPNRCASLTLEIIERSLISDTEKTFALLSELRDMEINISIDDFGTGYSSLAYFKSIPADELKIDKSFIDDLVTNRDNLNIVKLIIHLAHSFNMQVVAEGVEEKVDLAALKKLKCDLVQGYYISKPIPSEEYQEWLLNFPGLQLKQSQ
jgi:diguanylate cyclase (GGDEF)-like protein